MLRIATQTWLMLGVGWDLQLRQLLQEFLGSHGYRHQALDQVHDRVGAALFTQEVVWIVHNPRRLVRLHVIAVEVLDDSEGRRPLIIKDHDPYPHPPTNTYSLTLNSEESLNPCRNHLISTKIVHRRFISFFGPAECDTASQTLTKEYASGLRGAVNKTAGAYVPRPQVPTHPMERDSPCTHPPPSLCVVDYPLFLVA